MRWLRRFFGHRHSRFTCHECAVIADTLEHLGYTAGQDAGSPFGREWVVPRSSLLRIHRNDVLVTDGGVLLLLPGDRIKFDIVPEETQ